MKPSGGRLKPDEMVRSAYSKLEPAETVLPSGDKIKSDETVLPVNSKSKDRLFQKVYESPESRKNLASFLLGGDFTKAELKNARPVIFGNKENDLAFILDGAIYLMMEEQSYPCPNMAYRILEYIVAALRSTVDSEKALYGTKLVPFPLPKLYEVRVGLARENERPKNIYYEIRLEDSYIRLQLYMQLEPDLNLTVHTIDFRMTYEETLEYIEKEKLPERLGELSNELFQYALTANCITYMQAALKEKNKNVIRKPCNINSVAEVLELLKSRGVLYELLGQKEVFDMTMATFSRDDILLYQGIEEGRTEGEDNMCSLIRNLLNDGRNEDVQKAVTDPDYRGKLMREYAL